MMSIFRDTRIRILHRLFAEYAQLVRYIRVNQGSVCVTKSERAKESEQMRPNEFIWNVGFGFIRFSLEY